MALTSTLAGQRKGDAIMHDLSKEDEPLDELTDVDGNLGDDMKLDEYQLGVRKGALAHRSHSREGFNMKKGRLSLGPSGELSVVLLWFFAPLFSYLEVYFSCLCPFF